MRATPAVRLFAVGMLLLSCRTVEKQESTILDAESDDRAGVHQQTEDKLFDNSVSEIHIHLHGDTWRQIITHKNDGGYACDDDAPYGHVKEFKFIHKRSGQTTVINNVGLSVKGNTTCDDPAEVKGWKIKFNVLDKFIENADGNEIWRIPNVTEEWGKRLDYPPELAAKIKKQRLFGLKGIALRKGGNDPTRLRDSIASDVFEYGGHLARKSGEAGAPDFGGGVYRAGIVWVRIHNGLGTLVEGHYGLAELMDEDFVELHYGEDSMGNLFKINHGKGTFLGSDMPANNWDWLFGNYEPKLVDGEEFTSKQEYDIKQRLCAEGKLAQNKCDKLTKERQKAEKILLGFRSMLGEAAAVPDREARRQRIRSFLDVDAIMSYMAAANLTGHWDSLVGAMSNNDYLFMDAKTKKWSILTWDLDNTLGAGVEQYTWMANATDFGVDLKYRPLFKLILDNFHDEYKGRVQQFLDGVYDFKGMDQKITWLRDQIAPDSQEDRFQNLYRFKNHRYGNAYCHLNKGSQSRVKMNPSGWPDVYEKNGRYVAECH